MNMPWDAEPGGTRCSTRDSRPSVWSPDALTHVRLWLENQSAGSTAGLGDAAASGLSEKWLDNG